MGVIAPVRLVFAVMIGSAVSAFAVLSLGPTSGGLLSQAGGAAPVAADQVPIVALLAPLADAVAAHRHEPAIRGAAGAAVAGLAALDDAVAAQGDEPGRHRVVERAVGLVR